MMWQSDVKNPFMLPKSQDRTVVRNVDIKTGRIYEDKVDQVDLYNLVSICMTDIFPREAESSAAQLWYLDQGQTRPEESWTGITRSDIEKEKKRWEKRVRPMMMDEAFLPTPGEQCRYCPHRKSVGGACRF